MPIDKELQFTNVQGQSQYGTTKNQNFGINTNNAMLSGINGGMSTINQVNNNYNNNIMTPHDGLGAINANINNNGLNNGYNTYNGYNNQYNTQYNANNINYQSSQLNQGAQQRQGLNIQLPQQPMQSAAPYGQPYGQSYAQQGQQPYGGMNAPNQSYRQPTSQPYSQGINHQVIPTKYIPYSLNQQKMGPQDVILSKKIINPQAEGQKQQSDFLYQQQSPSGNAYCLKLFGFGPHKDAAQIIQIYEKEAKIQNLTILDQKGETLTIQTENYNDIEKLVKSCPFPVKENDEIRFYGCCNIENENFEIQSGNFEGFKENDFLWLKFAFISFLGLFCSFLGLLGFKIVFMWIMSGIVACLVVFCIQSVIGGSSVGRGAYGNKKGFMGNRGSKWNIIGSNRGNSSDNRGTGDNNGGIRGNVGGNNNDGNNNMRNNNFRGRN